jgi:hypothetical protein
MTEQTTNEPTTEAPAVEKTPAELAADEVTANIATARDMHHKLGHDIKSVASWLVTTTRGAIGDIEAAIKHIL